METTHIVKYCDITVEPNGNITKNPMAWIADDTVKPNCNPEFMIMEGITTNTIGVTAITPTITVCLVITSISLFNLNVSSSAV